MPVDSPIFIVGSVRSGTTLFRLILGGHPAIGYAEEHEFGFDELGDHGFPPPEQLHAVARTHRQLLARGFRIDEGLSSEALLKDLLRQADERAGKPEVAAVVHTAFHRLPELWPQARFIHVLRDPRDVAPSCVKMGWSGNPYYGVEIWLRAQQRWDQLCRRVPAAQRYVVRYEELVESPVKVVEGVCGFLDLPYDDAMFDYPSRTSYSDVNANMGSQWKRKLSARDARRVEARCGAMLAARGYEPSSDHPAVSRAEEAFLMVDHRVRRAQSSIRRYGLYLWTMQRVASICANKRWQDRLAMRQVEIDRQHIA